MRVAIIGRSELMYETAVRSKAQGHEIALIVTAKEAPEYTKTAEDFEALAKNLNVPFMKTSKIHEIKPVVTTLEPIEIAISINYTGIIPQEIIDLFPQGILNAHGGDLPRYRGNACQAWAILNGEDRIGLCVHKMVGGELDSGDIIARDYLPIDHNTKVTQAWDWMVRQIPELMQDALHKLSQDPHFVLETQSRDPKHALRCYPRRPEDGQIDWHKSNIEILRLINACNRPYAGAFCLFDSKKVIIWDAELAQEENFLAVPGQVTTIGDGYVEVAAGNGKLRINEMEVEGNLVTTPDKIIRSIRHRFVSN